METDKDTLFVIDGYGQIYRSYYAFMSNPLRDRQGNNISSVYGFFNTLFSLIKQYKPRYLAVALDSRGKTFRHDLFPEYKANREKTPEDLHAQIPMIKEVLKSMNIRFFAVEGMEADDIIATLAKDAKTRGIQTVMVTGDKDLLQLVDSDTGALRPPRRGEHDWMLCKEKEVEDLFGIRPDQIVDYLTILGDSSDNVPGIAGIGEKGAVTLLKEWGTLDNAYENIDSIKGGLRTKLEAARDNIGLSRTLITLKNNVLTHDEIDLESALTDNIDWQGGVSYFRLMGSERLTLIATKMGGGRLSVPKKPEDKKQEPVSTETLGVVPDFYVGFDLKNNYPQTGKALFDVMIAAWLLDSGYGHYTVDDIYLKYYRTEAVSTTDEKIKALCPVLYTQLKKNGLYNLFEEMEMPLLAVLHEMESNGILLDSPTLNDYARELKEGIAQTEQDIYTLCGQKFNLNSPAQLQQVLFVDRELPTGKKTKRGFSTDSDILEDLAKTTDDPVPALILRYRAMSKLLNTYVLTLPNQVDLEGRIHTTFLQTGTATGRLSSKNPNLQNIPIRTEEGRRIRNAFVARQGCTLLSADYAQIELAVLAHVSNDPELCKAFVQADDVHRQTAALIFNVGPEEVTPSQRRIAKTINFGVIYGMSAFRLAGDLGISRKDAQGFIDTYFERYSGVSSFIKETIAKAEKEGFVTTQMGHRRSVPDINSSNRTVRQASERIAVNSVIQGSAAEIVKIAMINIDRALKKQKLNSRLLLQVHDEVILEVPDDELETVKNLVKTEMEGAVKLSIPLRVSIETGKRWGELH